MGTLAVASDGTGGVRSGLEVPSVSVEFTPHRRMFFFQIWGPCFHRSILQDQLFVLATGCNISSDLLTTELGGPGPHKISDSVAITPNPFFIEFPPSTRFSQSQLILSFTATMTTFESGRQFFVHPVTAQTFYWEPVNGTYSQWTALDPSDYHPPRPESHNVRRFADVFLDLC